MTGVLGFKPGTHKASWSRVRASHAHRHRSGARTGRRVPRSVPRSSRGRPAVLPAVVPWSSRGHGGPLPGTRTLTLGHRHARYRHPGRRRTEPDPHRSGEGVIGCDRHRGSGTAPAAGRTAGDDGVVGGPALPDLRQDRSLPGPRSSRGGRRRGRGSTGPISPVAPVAHPRAAASHGGQADDLRVSGGWHRAGCGGRGGVSAGGCGCGIRCRRPGPRVVIVHVAVRIGRAGGSGFVSLDAAGREPSRGAWPDQTRARARALRARRKSRYATVITTAGTTVHIITSWVRPSVSPSTSPMTRAPPTNAKYCRYERKPPKAVAVATPPSSGSSSSNAARRGSGHLRGVPGSRRGTSGRPRTGRGRRGAPTTRWRCRASFGRESWTACTPHRTEHTVARRSSRWRVRAGPGRRPGPGAASGQRWWKTTSGLPGVGPSSTGRAMPRRCWSKNAVT